MIRVHVSWNGTYEDAHGERADILQLHPDLKLQIRRKQRGFEIVERVVGEVKAPASSRPSKRKKKKYGYETAPRSDAYTL